MIFFSQRKPKAFDYKPRYYDPEKERREQRRRELWRLGYVYSKRGVQTRNVS